MAAVGVLSGEKKQRDQIKNMEYKSEQMKYAPWSKTAQAIASESNGEMADPLASGLQGAAMGSQISGGFGGAAKPGQPSGMATPGAPMHDTAMGQMPVGTLGYDPNQFKKYSMYKLEGQ
jgi:hypothetical protein